MNEAGELSSNKDIESREHSHDYMQIVSCQVITESVPLTKQNSEGPMSSS